MNLKQYLSIFAFGTLIAFAAWVMVLLNVDPLTSEIGGLVFFLLTLFSFLAGLFTILGTLVRGLRSHGEDVERIVQTSFRQGLFLASLVILALILKRNDAFTWWTLSLLIALVAFVEFLAQSMKTSKTSH